MAKKGPRIAVGIDFGGTFVKMALVDDRGRIRARERVSTKEATTREAWLKTVAAGVDDLCRAAHAPRRDLSGIGVGVPGFVDFKKGFIHDLTNVPGWTGVHLGRILTRKLGLPAFVENDVNAMALGECRYGAGQGYEHAVFVTVGTGVGGGIVVHGQLYRGAFSMAGEIGHISIQKDGIRSPRGRGGLEQYVGNRRIVARAVRELKKGRRSKIRKLVQGRLDMVTVEAIATAAAAGDPLALEIFDFMGDCLATAFASVTYVLQPEVFIVGGGVSHSGKVLFDPLDRHLKERLSPFFYERVKIKPAKLGNDAGVIGAASLVLTSPTLRSTYVRL